MTDWYYADAARQRHGPVSTEALVQRYRQGLLPLDSLVWREGLANWQPLRDFSETLALPETGVEHLADAPALTVDTATPAAADPVQTAVYAGTNVVYAGFWKRVAANCIDSIVVSVVGGLIGVVFGLLLGAFFGFGSGLEGGAYVWTQVIVNLISLAIAAAYYAWFHASRHQATPGKLAIGIKVVRSDGEAISLARGIGRYFALILSSLLLGIGLLMAAFTQRKQALHDLICDTLVVDKWAFTEHPERQQPELGTVTVVILVIMGLLVLATLALVVLVIAAVGGAWNWS
ncbi:MAG: RDD family protein [Pseudoxanthomonas sp.]|nr:RDD family protein [Pseudoxanthomonas sp.]